jgi:CPA2 family monovalent cation:H+ antiporter-2
MHSPVDLTQIALVMLFTLGLGLCFQRMRQPAILGYILAGVLLGPHILGAIHDRQMVNSLADLGVLMLMFLTGMELSIRAFKSVWGISLSVTLLQLVGSILAFRLVALVFPLSPGMVIVLSICVALSSTAVAIKMLETLGELKTETGRLAVGVLIAQDLAVVPLILWMRHVDTVWMSPNLWIKLVLALGILLGLVMLLSRREAFSLPFHNLLKNDKDLLTLMSLLFCFGMAALTGLIELSAAYGAFLAGIILGNTHERHMLIDITKPIQSVLMMVFFLSVGILLDFRYIWDHKGIMTVSLLLITIGKSGMNVILFRLGRRPWSQCIFAGLVLSQVGEFAFLFAGIGVDETLISLDDQQMIISLTALSLALSPLWFMVARRLHGPDMTLILQNAWFHGWHKWRGGRRQNIIQPPPQVSYIPPSSQDSHNDHG